MKTYNFSAGPARLPEEVLKEVQSELLDFNSLGSSILEISHRSKDFIKVVDTVKADLRSLANIPDDYEILFLQGGASTQFAMVPMNLMINKKADYIDTGVWSTKAFKEASLFGDAKIIASSKDRDYSYIPNLSNLDIREDADYVHMTENNTIYGTEFTEIPDTKGKILINDASSNILSREFDINKFGLVYAGAQKNLGPAGITLVIIKKDLIRDELTMTCPSMLKYKNHYDKESMYNTPTTFAIYVMGKVIKWLIDLGGLKEMARLNKEKADYLYNFLDSSRLYKGYAEKEFRSRMNVTFTTSSEDLDKKFVEEAKTKGLITLKGHRNLGGLRASIYNAMPLEGVKSLVEFMSEFERANK